MSLRALIAFLFLGLYCSTFFVFATNEIQPEPCFRCPESRCVDDSVCGTNLYQIFYSGNWVHCKEGCTAGDYECTESSTCDPRAYAKFTFIGNRVRLYAAVGPWGGEACVKIDYQNPQDVHFCSPECQGNVEVYDSGLLPYGRHVLLISNKSPNPIQKITIDRIEVTRYPNLIQNPSFEEKCPTCPYSEDLFPPRWTADSLLQPVTLKWDCEVAHTGTKSFLLSSECPNFAYVFQNVQVRRNVNCLISAWIKTNNVEHCDGTIDAGASVGPLNNALSHYRSQGLFGCNDWTRKWVTFNTCENDYVTVAGQLGSDCGLTSGCVWFDDFEFICDDTCDDYQTPPVIEIPS